MFLIYECYYEFILFFSGYFYIRNNNEDVGDEGSYCLLIIIKY